MACAGTCKCDGMPFPSRPTHFNICNFLTEIVQVSNYNLGIEKYLTDDSLDFLNTRQQ